MFFAEVFSRLSTSPLVKLLTLCIAMDVVLGVTRAIKEGKINSTVGIDGIIRKMAMLVSVAFFAGADVVLGIDIIGWLPTEALQVFETIGIQAVGICDLFGLVFVGSEFLSILKNLLRSGVKIPKGVYDKLYNILDRFTDELKDFPENQ